MIRLNNACTKYLVGIYNDGRRGINSADQLTTGDLLTLCELNSFIDVIDYEHDRVVIITQAGIEWVEDYLDARDINAHQATMSTHSRGKFRNSHMYPVFSSSDIVAYATTIESADRLCKLLNKDLKSAEVS